MIFVGESEGFLRVGIEGRFSFVVLRRATADLVLDGVQGFHVEQLQFFRRDRRAALTDGTAIGQRRFVTVSVFLEEKERLPRASRGSSRLSSSSVDVVRVFEQCLRSSPETIAPLRCRT